MRAHRLSMAYLKHLRPVLWISDCLRFWNKHIFIMPQLGDAKLKHKIHLCFIPYIHSPKASVYSILNNFIHEMKQSFKE